MLIFFKNKTSCILLFIMHFSCIAHVIFPRLQFLNINLKTIGGCQYCILGKFNFWRPKLSDQVTWTSLQQLSQQYTSYIHNQLSSALYDLAQLITQIA